MAGEVGFATLCPRHCERSEAIHLSACGEMNCFVAFAPLRKRFAFVAGNDGESWR
jgi:hypothetical protein